MRILSDFFRQEVPKSGGATPAYYRRALFISEALQPAKVVRVDTEISTTEDGSVERHAKVIVPDQQFSLAIGKSGQNVRLAARLTGFKIDIRKESDESDEAAKVLTDGFQVVDETEDKGEA